MLLFFFIARIPLTFHSYTKDNIRLSIKMIVYISIMHMRLEVGRTFSLRILKKTDEKLNGCYLVSSKPICWFSRMELIVCVCVCVCVRVCVCVCVVSLAWR